MLSKQDNETITRVGPGTPMGELMRQYWLPAMLSRELPTPDSHPVRVMLLCEQLIAYRDTSGKIGLVGDHCPHRGASLFFGRNEEHGLRCVYHGWKFDISGACVDMPNEPPESNFKEKIHHTAYPTQERGGIVWAYLGPRSTPPPLPDIEANMLPAGQWDANAIIRDCNWLQSLEGDIDTSHLGFLHMGHLKPDMLPAGGFGYHTVKDRAPRYAVVDTDYGVMYGAYRPANAQMNYWRIAQFLFPVFTHIPTGTLGLQILTRVWVPMDDTHTMYFNMGAPGATAGMDFSEALPNGTGWYDRFRLPRNASNDYLIDREAQRTMKSYTGLSSIHLEDQALTEQMGPILDRTVEHLGTSDTMVIRTRRRLLAAARALVDQGITPPGVDHPEVYRVRSGSCFLPKDADWVAETQHLVPAFVDHPDLDPDPRILA